MVQCLTKNTRHFNQLGLTLVAVDGKCSFQNRQLCDNTCTRSFAVTMIDVVNNRTKINSLKPSHAIMIYVIIGLHNGLSPTWHKDITWTNTDLLSIGYNRRNSIDWNLYERAIILVQGNASENICPQKVANLFRYHVKHGGICLLGPEFKN